MLEGLNPPDAWGRVSGCAVEPVRPALAFAEMSATSFDLKNPQSSQAVRLQRLGSADNYAGINTGINTGIVTHARAKDNCVRS
jgi:hypothetical protein